MGKRRTEAVERRQKKARSEQDALLTSGVFARKSTHGSDSDDDEHAYELAPRSLNISTAVDALPIKNKGKIERVVREKAPVPEPEIVSEDDAKADAADSDAGTSTTAATEPADPDAHLSPAEKLQKIKAEVAELASGLMEDPEEHIDSLGKLRVLAESSNLAAQQLAILALVPVFKSLAPSYKIRPLTETEQRERVSKDIARLRRFEQTLVVQYQAYISLLTRLARVSASNSQNNSKIEPQQVRMGELAAKAACELCLSSLRHFNFRDDLFAIPIRRLNRKPTAASDLEVFRRCVRTLETLFADDREHGAISHDVSRIMCKVIRDKKFRVDEAVVNIFLSLSVLHDYEPHAEKGDAPKMKKKNRVHLTKKQRKQRKENKQIDEEMRQAETALTAAERERFQADTLKNVLMLYLEILRASVDGPARQLTAAVMEGLARFGQMANFDLLGDFLTVLKEIMADIVAEKSLHRDSYGVQEEDTSMGQDDGLSGVYSAHDVRKLLLCVTAAFSLVLNHGEVGKLPVSFDLLQFTSTLYTVLVDVALSPDLEFSHKSLRLVDPLSASGEVDKPAVNVSTNAELLLKSLDSVFFRSRTGSVARAAPFTKRLYMAALHAPEKTTVASLKFVAKLINRYGSGLKSLWSTEENVSGEGNYILGTERENMEVDLERSNVGSAVLWENILLDKHYCGVIKDGSRSLMKNSRDVGGNR